MPVNTTYPGVYVEELQSAVRTITGVPTAVAAFVGLATRGPVNAATHITSWADFERIFGGLSDSSLMSYAVFHFYQNGGSEAEIVRVVTEEKAATIELVKGVTLAVKKPGEAGNSLRFRVDHVADPKSYRLTLRDTDAQNPSEEVVTVSTDPTASNTLTAELADSGLVSVPADSKLDVLPAFTDPDPETFIPAVGGANSATFAILRLPLAGDSQHLMLPIVLTAKYQGTWGNNLAARVDYHTAPAPPGTNTRLYNLTIRDMGSGAEETFRNIVADASSSQNLANTLKQSALVTAEDNATAGMLPQDSAEVAPGLDPFDPKSKLLDAGDNRPRPATVASGGDDMGSDGSPATEADLAGTQAGKTGIYALLSTDIFNMLCIPPITRDADFTGDLLSQALQLCVDRRAMLLVDSPRKWKDVNIAVSGALAGRPLSGVNTTNAVIYFPRIRMLDATGQVLDFPPCGVMAGVWARTDTTRGVWKAPAGIDASLNGVQELAVSLTDKTNGQLNPLGVNCLRTFPIIGPVAWGARTILGADALASQWKYIPVRRTALFIEETLYRNTKWVVFEPNDEPLWSSIRLNVGAFMNTLFRQGAFQGSTAREAYLVKCDKENNPQNDIDRGIVNILVGFAPLKPAEFVIIHIEQLAGQLTT